jgi:TonB family protein
MMRALLGLCFACALLLASTFGMTAAIASDDSNALYVSGIIEVDATGKVETVRVTSSPLRPEMEQRVLEAVRGWTFNPFEVDGVARRIRTSMDLRLELVKREQGHVLEFAETRFGQPVLIASRAPRYPSIHLERRLGASLLMAITVEDDGSVSSAEPVRGQIIGARLGGENGIRQALKPFAQSARNAMLAWRYDFLEPVSNGEKRRFLVPIKYTLSGPGMTASQHVSEPVLFENAAALDDALHNLLAQQGASGDQSAATPLQPGLTLREDAEISGLAL